MPNPKKNETKKEFISRCMAYPDLQSKSFEQRYAICQSRWESKRGKGKK